MADMIPTTTDKLERFCARNHPGPRLERRIPNDPDCLTAPYTDAGHDAASLFANGGGKCSRCGAPLINLAEDMVYGAMRKCVQPATPVEPGEVTQADRQAAARSECLSEIGLISFSAQPSVSRHERALAKMEADNAK